MDTARNQIKLGSVCRGAENMNPHSPCQFSFIDTLDKNRYKIINQNI